MLRAETRDQEEPELDLLLEAVHRTYHYDFRRYARPFLQRRVAQARAASGSATLTELLERVVQDPAAFGQLLRHLTVGVTDMFRDPEYFRLIRERVVPILATYPSPRIWVAGCGSGEEAWSFALLLHEEGLLERSFIYATDIDQPGLEAARAGIYELERVRGFSQNYLRAGGRASLSDHYTTAYGRAALSARLRERLLFADHSLATDSAFAEVQLVSCRNVLIYFDHELQDRAIGLFREALSPRGFLGLGAKETLELSREAGQFEPFARAERVYRKR